MTTVNALTAALGGEEVQVTLNNGDKVAVKVRVLPIRLMPKFCSVVELEEELIELVCMPCGDTVLESGWSDSLSIESHVELVEKARALNFTRAGDWLRRQLKLKEQFEAQKITTKS